MTRNQIKWAASRGLFPFVHGNPAPRRPIFHPMTQLAPHHDLPTDKDTGEPLSPIQRRRVGTKFKKTVKFRIEKGLTWQQACTLSGYGLSAFYKALAQPHCTAYYEREKGKYISDMEGTLAIHKAHSIKVARDLLDDKDKPAQRAKMVEFLRGEGRKSQTNQQVQVNIGTDSNSGGRYAFARPGQKVVEITVGDGQSPGPEPQTIDITPETE